MRWTCSELIRVSEVDSSEEYKKCVCLVMDEMHKELRPCIQQAHW